MQSSVTYADRPTQSDIIRKVQPMPKLMQDCYIQAHYVGVGVRWSGRFFQLSNDGVQITGKYLLSFDQRGFHRRSSGLIYVNIVPGQFPELEMLPRGTRVDLYGTIQEVDAFLGVTLELHQAEVLPRNLWDRVIGFSERRY